ncbi:hypothetical protein [Paractinoplanes bogorensis]|nr:hypothetical protein [Actinoplanes bogorensis]
MSALTISWPILIRPGTAAAPKPVDIAIAISTTWVNAAMTMLYWVDSESRANLYAASPSEVEICAPVGTFLVMSPWNCANAVAAGPLRLPLSALPRLAVAPRPFSS